jgi:predicted outer membrane repeat protein
VTVTASTFSRNTSAGAFSGAIDSGFGAGGGGTVTVTASTFTGNPASFGGAIDSGFGGGGTVTVTASTFTGNTAISDGGAIDSGDGFGSGGTVSVTASTFAGNTASQDGGAIDSGDNTGGGTVTVAADVFDGSCHQPSSGTWTDGGFNAGTDTSCFASSPPASDKSGSTVASELQTAPADNGGPTKTIAPTTGNPAIALIPNPTTITLGSSHVVLCPATDQRAYPSASSTKCDAGAVQTTGWPPQVSGIFRPHPHAAEGYYLGVNGSAWSLIVTHPGGRKVTFTGTITLNAGAFRHVTSVDHETGDSVHVRRQTVTFRFTNFGFLDGVTFAITPPATTITFTLTINGHPATARQIHLGRPPHHAGHGSPLTFHRKPSVCFTNGPLMRHRHKVRFQLQNRPICAPRQRIPTYKVDIHIRRSARLGPCVERTVGGMCGSSPMRRLQCRPRPSAAAATWSSSLARSLGVG